MLEVSTDGYSIRFGERFSVSFQRTLRIPDDGKNYPLPPSLGSFPIFHVADYKDRVPASWVERGGLFIPMYQREALWLNFDAAHWKPNAVKIGVGKINAISGRKWDQTLKRGKADYIVCPDQPWLDGINAGDGYIKQFVAMPRGMGYTIEGQIPGEEVFGGIQVIAYEPKPGKFPDEPPERSVDGVRDFCAELLPCYSAGMGLAAGGRMKQKIYPDPYGIGTWDPSNYGRVFVHIVNSMDFREITGLEPPPTPVSAAMYSAHGYPWFDLYDEDKGDVKAAKRLKKVKTVKEMDKEKGLQPQQDDNPIEIPPGQVVVTGGSRRKVEGGGW
jgi:hypothetical protein